MLHACATKRLYRATLSLRPTRVWAGSFSDVADMLWPVAVRSVTSLGHQEGRRVFREGPKFFELCPIFLNYVQHIFPEGGEKFPPPLVTVRAVRTGIEWCLANCASAPIEGNNNLSLNSSKHTKRTYCCATSPRCVHAVTFSRTAVADECRCKATECQVLLDYFDLFVFVSPVNRIAALSVSSPFQCNAEVDGRAQ